jgi:c-di-GMP-binding flagellar brake protein YcgR
MESRHVLNRSLAAGVLAQAAERSQTLDLLRLLESGEDACRSRFVPTKGRHVTVEVPSRQGHRVPIRTGESVEVYFRLGPQRYWFASKVRERSTVRLSTTLELQVLVLDRPSKVELRQRRGHFRVKLQRLMARLWRVPREGDASPEALPAMEVLDLSAGGARLLNRQTAACRLNPGERLVVTLPLRSGWPDTTVHAVVTRCAPAGDGVSYVGLQFLGLEDTAEGRQIQDRLHRYVTERERQEIRRTRERTE